MSRVTTSIFIAVFVFSLPSYATAGLVFSFTETLDGVLVEGTGSFNITGLTEIQTPFETPFDGGFVLQAPAAIGLGVGAVDYFDIVDFTGPESFGDLLGIGATGGSGDPFGFDLWDLWVVLPEGYNSGDLLEGSGVYEGETFETMELFEGTFEWTLEDGETITVNVVPEPASAALVLALVVGGAVVSRRRAR